MNPHTRWVALCVLLLCLPLQAMAEEVEDFIPGFDPSNPMAGLPSVPGAPEDKGIEPIAPQEIPTAEMPPVPDVGKGTGDLPPLPKGEDEFEFFQPGYQIGDDGDGEEEKPAEKPIEIKPKPKATARAALPLVRFNYKNQRLPYPIYAKQQSGDNHHLPIAMYEHDYDATTFAAVMTNNVNGLRAMLNGGRNIAMRSPQGESLVQVAIRYGAHDCLRLLLARGADPHGNAPRDHLSYYALRAAGAR